MGCLEKGWRKIGEQANIVYLWFMFSEYKPWFPNANLKIIIRYGVDKIIIFLNIIKIHTIYSLVSLLPSQQNENKKIIHINSIALILTD